ncbi:MAG: ribosome small subunit-dependent GTPase A [Spirochaetota bacterium]
MGCPVFVTSTATGEGLGDVRRLLEENKTAVLAGSSGVGKSSIINCLLGDSRRSVQSVRKGDGKGRHTTTVSELLVLPDGGCIIDTPGMRELQLWGSEEGLENTFSEIYEAAKNCRFRDCTHQGEPGCRVEELLAEGGLDPKRYQNYLNMRAELNYLESRVSEKGRLERKNREKQLSRIIKKFNKKRD